MTNSRPYLLRALFEWILDNDTTPCLMVDAGFAGTDVPMDYVNDKNEIILNISPSACVNLNIGNAIITCTARFSGRSVDMTIPLGAVLGIFARENGQGMMFGYEPGDAILPPDTPPDEPPPDKPDPKTPRPDFLKVVK